MADANEPDDVLRRALYADCSGDGEAQMVWREDTLCLGCAHVPVCAIYRAVSVAPNLLVSISRCRAFEPSTD